ncbi:ATP-dependent DNA helicase [Lacticaseibacillus pantheris]
MATTRIGVRELVEFTVRSGDLNPVTQSSNNTAMMGSRIHRRIQDAHADNSDYEYESEVYLKRDETIADVEYTIDGRADGVITPDDGPVILEEIKTSARDFDQLTPNTVDRYWAQAETYGHYLCTERELDGLTIDLIYVNTRNQAEGHHRREYTAAQLADNYQALITEFGSWIKLRSDIIKRRNETAAALQFPFPEFRAGQHDFAGAVYKTIYTGQRLFVQAPTGTGKTISTLFPAVKAMGAGLINRAFYLTAKAATRHVAEDAMGRMGDAGLTAKSITITARDTIRFDDEPDEPTQNPYMLGYYDRLKPALLDMLANNDLITRAVVEEYARKHTVDPFEFSLDASLFCDVIICDYNYLFDPRVFLQRFFANPDPENCFLVDEAHNLVDRARNMYSAAISRQAFADIIPQLSGLKSGRITRLRKSIRGVEDTMDVLDTNLQRDEHFQQEPIEPLIDSLDAFATQFHEWLEAEKNAEVDQVLDAGLDAFFAANAYLKIAELYDDAFETRVARDGADLTVKQMCLNPSQFVDERLALGHGAVLFSATLTPMDYYRDVLGGTDNSLAYTLPSPFPPANQAVIVAGNVRTTYRERTASLPALIAALTVMVTARSGHYLVFCPSYAYLETVHDAFVRANPQCDVVAQRSAMSAADRKAFLDAFAPGQPPVVGFAVLGGSFAEGIDLRGQALIGVAVVSVGLPGLSSETDRIKQYYQQRNGQGFAYAYQLPGLNNVLQAGGRVIRGAHDVGVILLLDARFNEPRYRQLLPAHWQVTANTRSTRELAATLTNFWAEHPEPSDV